MSKFFDSKSTFEDSKKAWDAQAKRSALEHPLKILSHLPQMPGITPDTAKGLKWKSLKYIIQHDTHRILPRYFFKRPLFYLYNFLKSAFRKQSFLRDASLTSC